MRRLRVRVSGRVQGVGFRWFVRRTAEALELAGWVRNSGDGSVELAVEGPERGVAALIDAVREGPEGAHVEAVEELGSPEEPELPRPFAIRR